ncbi:MAG TPA: flagellin [Phycisphaerae bacterium]|nr:flagellin [Phycisphaerae bacterium]HOB75269.1 flagellin [Phycisphaerae bacterium]HQA44820.1 flagellin [Phycisphaerae bacterium]HQE44545.1 flagellin [Phycisphaerae bacterium]HXK87532.1 flagellin [Phycisphaerae bacterium]
MARINTNVSAVIAQRTLRQNQRDLSLSLERLSSGLRINRGADDPAGLINSESLRAEIAGANQAISNSQRAINIIATAEGALNEVASLLIDIQRLVVESANTGALSADEIRANQLQIDSAVESITRIANTTTFAGRNLLDGSLDYVCSGVNKADIPALELHSVQFGTANFIPVDVVVTTSAQKAELQFRNSQTTTNVTLEISGPKGATTLSFLSGTRASAIIAAVNIISDATGVGASLINSANPASGVTFRSAGYGSDQMVSIKPLHGAGTFPVVNTDGDTVVSDRGRDAVARINGIQSVGRGLNLYLHTTGLSLSMTLGEDFGLNSTSFMITGGGAVFQLGPDVNTNQQVSIGLQSVAASRLGNTAVGFLSQIVTGSDYSVEHGHTTRASEIVNEAIRQVAVLRGRLGSFERNTLQTNINSLSITVENLTASESAIRDTDFAVETSRLTRSQILVNAGTSVLALANSTPQSVLSLLQG